MASNDFSDLGAEPVGNDYSDLGAVAVEAGSPAKSDYSDLGAEPVEAPKKDGNFFENIRNFFIGLGQKQQEAATRKQQQDAAAQQVQAAHDADPVNWSSSRFRKDAPKPQTPEDQAIYDATLEEKKTKEKEMVAHLLGQPTEAMKNIDPEQIGERVGQHFAQYVSANPREVGLKLFQDGIKSVDAMLKFQEPLLSQEGQQAISDVIERPVAGLRAVSEEMPMPEGAKKTVQTFIKGWLNPEHYPVGTFGKTLESSFETLKDDPQTPDWLKGVLNPTVAGALGATADAGYYFGMPEAIGRIVTAGKVGLLKSAIEELNIKGAPYGTTLKVPEEVYKATAANKDVFQVADFYMRAKNLKVEIEPTIEGQEKPTKPIYIEGPAPEVHPSLVVNPEIIKELEATPAEEPKTVIGKSVREFQPTEKEAISALIGDIQDMEAHRRMEIRDPNAPLGEQDTGKFIKTGYVPEYLRNKGVTKSNDIPILQKAFDGEPLTEIQTGRVNNLIGHWSDEMSRRYQIPAEEFMNPKPFSDTDKQEFTQKGVEANADAEREIRIAEGLTNQLTESEKTALDAGQVEGAERLFETAKREVLADASGRREPPKDSESKPAVDLQQQPIIPEQAVSAELLGQATAPTGSLKAKVPQSESPLTEFKQALSGEKQPELFTSGEAGFIDPGAISEAASTVINNGRDYISKTREIVKFTGDLERDFNKVLTGSVADEIRAKKLLSQIKLSNADAEAIYHYAEDKTAPITPEQKAIYERDIAPIQQARNELFGQIVNEGVPLSSEDYTPRFVADRGGIYERLKQTGKGLGGSVLRQTTESMKHRVMKAATDEQGNRIVVAVKGGEVYWNKTHLGSLGQPEGPRFKEFYDKVVMEKLNELAKNLGITHERVVSGKGLGGNRAGVSFQGADLVKTKYASPERVLLHEIGHQIDHKYGLQTKMFGAGRPEADFIIDKRIQKAKKAGLPTKDLEDQKIINLELRNLADLKWKDQETSNYFKTYVKKGTEKMAAMFESYLHVPDQFKEVAPLTYKRFTDFLASHEELKPILDLKPSMVLGMTKVAPEHLEPSVFLDNQGKHWKLGEATTKEIEKATGLKYHKNILLNELITYNRLNKVSRAIAFLNSFKENPEFQKIAMKLGEGNAPQNWKPTSLPQFRGYVFDPHVADALDKFGGDLKSRNAGNIFTAVNQFLRNAIFFNPMIHVPNITVHALVNRGAVGTVKTIMPEEFSRLLRTGGRAINAIITQNKDYLDMLESGANLLYSGQTKSLTKMMLERLGENKTSLQKLGEQLGIANPVNWIRGIYNMAGRVTWATNDLATMQAIYDKIEHGESMTEAIQETAKHIPDYRVPSRILNSAEVSKIMRDPNLTMFGAYHYGALKSYAEMAKTMAGDASVKDKTETFDKLLMLGILLMFVYPELDKLARKITGNPRATFRRAGAATFPHNIAELAQGKKEFPEVAQSVLTPAAGSKMLAELFLNRDFFTGKKVYNQGTEVQDLENKAIQSLSPTKTFQDIQSGKKSLKDFAASFMGISSPKTTPSERRLYDLIYDRKYALEGQVKKLLAKGDRQTAENLVHYYNARLVSLTNSSFKEEGMTVPQNIRERLKREVMKIPSQEKVQRYAQRQQKTPIERVTGVKGRAE